jgi:hypothetical protein
MTHVLIVVTVGLFMNDNTSVTVALKVAIFCASYQT